MRCKTREAAKRFTLHKTRFMSVLNSLEHGNTACTFIQRNTCMAVPLHLN